MGSYEEEAVELATILDTVGEGVFVIDPKGVIRRWNRAMERLTGYAAGEVVGKACSLLRARPSVQNARAFEVLQCNLFAQGTVDEAETCIRGKDGSEMPVLACARVMKDHGGRTLGAVIAFTDVSVVKRLEGEVRTLRQAVEERFALHNLVGKSRRMRDVFKLVELASTSQAPVLVTGEPGTGKELAAKAIHYHSDRREGPFVGVNCSALSEALLERELFGYARGAFRGAIQDYAGRLEGASGGTVFLAEVSDLTPLVQFKLLRVLEERALERVGESVPRPVDVRVIAATRRDLRERVRSGTFRRDLFSRLKAFSIHMPPLRERKEDIELLVNRFIDLGNKRTGKSIVGMGADALGIVTDYGWPGNVRELENAVAHAFVNRAGGYIGPFDLPVEIRRAESQQAAWGEALGGVRADDPAVARKRPATREELLRLLDECGWNKAAVGRRLGFTRTSVWRRMKTLGMPLSPSGGKTAASSMQPDPTDNGQGGAE